MSKDIGIACGSCDAFQPMGTAVCPDCGNELALDTRKKKKKEAVAAAPPPPAQPASSMVAARTATSGATAPRSPTASKMAAAPKTAAAKPGPTREELMEQARNYICKDCSSPVPTGHKFCGACGTTVPADIQQLRLEYFGAMQQPGKARLILIRGDQGVDGLSYLLQGTEHVAGRQDAQILFPEDAWLSPRHANFIYRGEKLVVRDEGSKNGVYLRTRGPVPLAGGDLFLCGEQVFRLEATPKDTSGPDPDQTYFYSSPKRPSPFRILQVLRGGHSGMVFCAREPTAVIGREDSDLNFADDVYMSGSHARIDMAQDGTFTLTDLNSRNGTYVRVKGERELVHGDYLFLGKQLLRVEMTT